MRAVFDMIVPGKRTKTEIDGLRSKVYAGTAAHPKDAQDRTFWKTRIRAADPS